MTDYEAAKMRHPASGSTDVLDRPQPDPYARFLDALKDLSLAEEMHGSFSLEVYQARRRVSAARDEAAAKWQKQQPAA